MSAQAIRMSPSAALFLSGTGSAVLGDQRQEKRPSPRCRDLDVQSQIFAECLLVVEALGKEEPPALALGMADIVVAAVDHAPLVDDEAGA